MAAASLPNMVGSRLNVVTVVSVVVLATAAASAPHPAPGAMFLVRPDLRMCPSPLCGGYWVSRVNRATTVCADGTVRPWCYVSEIDFPSATRPRANTLVRGRIVRDGTRSTGRFLANTVWRAATPAPWKGTVFLVTDTGIRCIRAPCFFLRLATVNTTHVTTASGVDFSHVEAADAHAREERAALTGSGLLVAGTLRRDVDGGRTVVAAQFFLAAG